MSWIRRILRGVVATILATNASATAGLLPDKLRCEYLTNPLGVDVSRPRLSWIVTSQERGARQSAYQVLVATSPERLAPGRADLWDSGKVVSDRTIGIVYEGQALRSGQRAYWRVRVWDQNDREAAHERTAWWEMGLLDAQDWQGEWIRRDDPPITKDEDLYKVDPAPLLRKAFRVRKPVARARAYVTGLGYYELYLNGRKVGDHVLDPTWTAYEDRVFYATYDVTERLERGDAAVGIMLGNGWYNPLPLRMWGRYNLRDYLPVGAPRALLQLRIDYEDGTRETIVTDTTWKAGDGPILKNSVYLGEVYDARKEQPGWSEPGFDASGWQQAVTATEPLGRLQAQTLPPIKVLRTIHPLRIVHEQPGVAVIDMGQNFAGRVRFRVKGPAGAEVHLRYGELLYPDGTLNGMTAVCGQIKRAGVGGPGAPDVAYQQDTYILKGGGEVETFCPRFTFHGFRYVELTGLPCEPTLDMITGELLGTDVEQVGRFACSDELYNRIQDAVVWTLQSNLFGVQSDCPHREKFGYGGDIVASSEMAMLNLDMAAFYAKAVQDFTDEVRPNHGITETAPFVGIDSAGFGEGSGPIGWGIAHPLLLRQLRQYYGNERLIDEHYEVAREWVHLLTANAKDHIIDRGISDHESLVKKPVRLTATAFYCRSARLVADLARLLGRMDEATRYARLAEDIAEAFNVTFAKGDSGAYDAGTQACQAFALYHDLVPQERRGAALEVLLRDIREKHQGHLSTGIFGTKYMLNVLTDAGRSDVAHTIAGQLSFPGWGHMLAGGATTLWEHWAFSDNTFSHNHPMFGSVSEWFFEALAGINAAPAAVGFDRIVIRPQPVGELRWVEAGYDSIRGPIRSAWRVEDEAFVLKVGIPANTKAEVHVPAAARDDVSEGGRPVSDAPGVSVVRMEQGAVVVKVGSGTYAFRSRRFERPGR